MPPRILVVDDDEQVRDFVTKTLRMRKYEVEDAPNGKEAIRALEAAQFDLVISDINMPNGNGADVAREVMLKHSPTQIIMMTGDAGYENATLTQIQVEFPSIKIMEKPLRPIPILQAIAEVLSRSSKARPQAEEEAHG